MAPETQTATARRPLPARAAVPQGKALSDFGDHAAFAAMRAIYHRKGGLARGDDLAHLLEDRARGDFVSLARLIVAGEVFGFESRHGIWIPLFQFDLEDLSIRPGLRPVLVELASEFDGWRLAAWFVEPNAWLDGALPIDLMDSKLSDVVQAARADRFVATG